MSPTITLTLIILAAGADHRPEQVKESLRDILPSGLAVVRVVVPPALSWSEAAEVRVHSDRALRRGTTTVRLTVRDEGEVQRGWATVRLAELRPVVVAARPLVDGQIIRAGDVVRARRPVQRGRGLDMLETALVGRAARGALEAGQVIDAGDVDLPAPVARRSPVRVLVRRGSVEIGLDGVLAEATRPGERGRALVKTSHRPLSGRLVDPRTFVVEVQP